MKSLSLDAFTLKLIAIISMGIHHTVMVLWEIFPIGVHIPMYFLRGVVFPIMAFFLVEGFRRTSNIKKYMLRLFIFALISQIPYVLALGVFMLNIIFTILLGLVCLILHDKLYVKMQKRVLFVLIFITILIASFPFFEGGFIGPLLIFMYHVIKDEKKRRVVPLLVWGGFFIALTFIMRMAFQADELFAETMSKTGGLGQLEVMMSQYFVFPVGTFLVIPLLLAYNGQRGRRAKYLFYSFYPLHWVILAIIAYAMGLGHFDLF